MSNSQRFDSIDLLRGLVMVIMALDHVRDYFHKGAFLFSPTDLEQTTPCYFLYPMDNALLCPCFCVFGRHICLHGDEEKRSCIYQQISFTRGLWLIFFEATFVSLAWTFSISLSGGFFQVIWAIGFSMVVLSLLCRLPYWLILLTGLVIVAGHNALDPLEFAENTPMGMFWAIMHDGGVVGFGKISYYIAYPVLPWIGVMLLGYCFGLFYTSEKLAEKRSSYLLAIGIASIIVFIVLRWMNVYGDPDAWSTQEDSVYSLMSFLNVHKYPPSLDYVLLTLGPAMIFLALADNISGKISDIFVTFGRVPLFYYLAHLYLIHLLAILNVLFFFPEFQWQEMIISDWESFIDYFKGYGYGLPGTYLVWIIVVFVLYFPSKKYAAYKKAHPEKWWLSYL
jgi:uncharacterized membrane protein